MTAVRPVRKRSRVELGTPMAKSQSVDREVSRLEEIIVQDRTRVHRMRAQNAYSLFHRFTGIRCFRFALRLSSKARTTSYRRSSKSIRSARSKCIRTFNLPKHVVFRGTDTPTVRTLHKYSYFCGHFHIVGSHMYSARTAGTAASIGLNPPSALPSSA